ncbi:hypothetical protein ACROYT_G004271 [Oculina patagonica]
MKFYRGQFNIVYGSALNVAHRLTSLRPHGLQTISERKSFTFFSLYPDLPETRRNCTFITDILACRLFKQIKIRRKSCFLTTLTVGNPQVFRAKMAERLIFIPFSAQFRGLRSHSSIDLHGEIGALLVSFRENGGFQFSLPRDWSLFSLIYFDS